MESYSEIEAKLAAFIKKYYTNELIRGMLLFFAIGLLYFLATLFIEHFLWLKPLYRTILFWLFISVELGLFFKFICLPIFKILGFKKGINLEQASTIIGDHFPEVNDKLVNLLQLKTLADTDSELLLASIAQKSKELTPIPFKIAINFKENVKFVKYLALPVLIFLLIQLSGNENIIKDSYHRVLNHDVAYTPPAPFSFIIKNENLSALEGKPFLLEVTTKGKVIPDDLKINFNNESYYLTKSDFNNYKFEFTDLEDNLSFYLESNEVLSKEYEIEIIEVPSIVNFEMNLDYPTHTGKSDEIISNTGNASVPEGTIINWKLKTKTTDKVILATQDTTIHFNKSDDIFSFQKTLFKNYNYELATANRSIDNHEQLGYKINVIKDAYPEINVQSKTDSIDDQTIYFLGKLSDDYGLSRLNLVYKKTNDNVENRIKLPLSSSNFYQFTYRFPGDLNLEKGTSYEYYFEVYDNDKINNLKRSKSALFVYNKLSDAELETKQLEEQQETIENLSKSLQKLNDQKKQLDDINKEQKEKNDLNWNDKNKLNQFLKRQEQQEQLMKKFNQDLQRNLDEFQKENLENDEFKEQLQERLKNQEENIEKNEKLLEELKDLQEKLNKEQLLDKIEKLAKENLNKEKSLEQILELTKRFYVSKKYEKLAKDLEELSEKQKELSNKSEKENTKDKQDELNKEFEKLQEDMKNIQKENKELKQPMSLDQQKDKQQEINQDQQQASEQLEKKKQQKAKQKQKDAAKKMKEMSQSMQMQMQGSSREEMEEDEKTLRQILDNLITYSFDQENLLDDFKNLNDNNYSFPKKLKEQYILKDHFKHVDDSLFALSLRLPQISELITKEVTDVHFNIDKSLERFSDQKIYLGIANQQYALTAANNLANYLGEILNSMQNQMNMPSMGGQCDKPGGEGFQLPDIIKKQEELMQQMKKEGQKSDQGKPNQGDSGKEGKSDKQGKDGKPKSGDNGNSKGEGEGKNSDENSSGKLFEIYKQQQELKNALKDLINKSGNKGNTGNLLKKMDEIEDQLLEKGFHDDVLQKMSELKHELLKLDKAAFEQGEDNKRNSETNNKQFTNTSNKKIPSIEQYFNEVEILNRQALPLQPIYKKKVKQYFKTN